MTSHRWTLVSVVQYYAEHVLLRREGSGGTGFPETERILTNVNRIMLMEGYQWHAWPVGILKVSRSNRIIAHYIHDTTENERADAR